MSRSTRPSAAPCALFSLLAALLAAVTYWFGTGTAAGREVDAYLLRHGSHGAVELIGDTLVFLVPPAAVLGVLALFALAWRAGRRGDAIRSAAIVAVGAGAAHVAKMALQDHDPLGSEAARRLGTGFFPSGHATIVMALCLAALLALPAPRRGLLLAVGVYASLLGFAICAGRSHHISDVYGGFLLAAAIAGLALVGRTPPRRGAAADRLEVVQVVKLIGLIIVGILVLESWRIIGAPHYVPGLVATAAAVPALAFVIISGYARLLER